MGRAAASAAVRPAVPSPSPALLTGGALALAVTVLPGESRPIALAAIITLGVPHGALDGEAARGVLHPRFGALWFGIFALPYLSLSAFVLAAWQVAPLTTLLLFLAASVWHFGSEEAETGRPVEAFVRGGLPIAMPVLAHPAATASVFATVAAVPLPPWLPLGLWAASLGWLAVAVTWGLEADRRRLLLPGVLAVMFVLLPPLPAFAIYFVCVHAPAHVAGVIRHPFRAPRVRDARSAVRLALPVTLLTAAIGAALWPFYPGAGSARLLTLTVQGLAALTLPHMALDSWLSRQERETA